MKSMAVTAKSAERRLQRAWLLAFVALLALCPAGGLAGCQRKPELPVLGVVPQFSLQDQSGRGLAAGDLRGKTWVAAFMFTRCPTICPKITQTMKGLQQRAQAEGVPLHWVSFSVDPDNDTPAVLREYAQEHQLDLSNWSFLTGNSKTIQSTAEQGFKIALEGKSDPKAPHYGITHGSHLVLVDGQGKIRGYYRTLDEQAQQHLIAQARDLK